MLLVNFKARQDPPPTQCPLFFPLEPRPLYFHAKRRRVSIDLLMQVKQKALA